VSARGVKGREENPLCDIRKPAKTRAKTNFVQGVMGAWMGVMVLSLNSLGNLSRINLFHEIFLCPVSTLLSCLETT
jgi:hypothetical protein